MEIVEGGVEAQTTQAMKNLKAVVEAGGSELGKVAKTTVRHVMLMQFAHVFILFRPYFRFS